jgi:hypothetical protein
MIETLRVPGGLVDILPEALWSTANLYRVFGRRLHFCVGDGLRTVEVDGVELGHGQRRVVKVHDAASDRVAALAWRVDLGWLGVFILGALAIAAAALTRR